MTTEPHFTRLVCREPCSPDTHAITPVVYNFHGGSQQLLRQLSSCSIATTSTTSAKRSLPHTPAWPGSQSSAPLSLGTGALTAPTPLRKHRAGAGRPRGKRAPRSASCSAPVFWAEQGTGILHMEQSGGTFRYVSGLGIKALAVTPKNKPFNYKD